MKKVVYFIFTKLVGAYINIVRCLSPSYANTIAHGYFSQPRKGKFTLDSIPETLRSAHFENILHNDEVIEIYKWKGNETIIFLIRGWESNSSRWEKMLPTLKKLGNTIVAIDGLAQGLSSGKELYNASLNPISYGYNLILTAFCLKSRNIS